MLDNHLDNAFYLNAKYNIDTNEVQIVASEAMLRHIQELLEDLANNQTSGRHYQFDKSSGLTGNITSIILERH